MSITQWSMKQKQICIQLQKWSIAHSAVLPYLLPLPQFFKFRGRGGWPKKFRGSKKLHFSSIFMQCLLSNKLLIVF